MTTTVYGPHDLLVWHLLHRPLALLLTRLLLATSLLDLLLLLRHLLSGASLCLLLGGLSLGALLRLTLRFDLRGRLAYRTLRTRLLARCSGLLRLTQLLRLPLPLVRGISLAVILAHLLCCTLTCLALGAQAHFLATEPALNGWLVFGKPIALAALLLLLLTAQALLGRLLLGHLTTALLLGRPALGCFATRTSLLGRLELDLLAQRQLMRSLLALGLAPIFLTAKTSLHTRIVIGLAARMGISI